MKRLTLYIAVLASVVLAACSTTAGLPEDEVLYAGIKRTTVDGKRGTFAESVALEEVNAALAYAPNGSFLGSSSVRTPFPIGLWIYNSLAGRQNTVFSRWLFNSFATEPVTMSHVAPSTRTKVATNLLQNYGYLNGRVDYSLIGLKNPRKHKIAYNITLGTPFIYDEIQYDFPAAEDSVLAASMGDTYLKKGGQFSTYDLTSEVDRVVGVLHNNGYYYYRPDYINYFADTINHPKHVTLLMQQDESTPLRAQRRYHIGRINVFVRKSSSTNSSMSRFGANQVYSDSVRVGGSRTQQMPDTAIAAPSMGVRASISADSLRQSRGYSISGLRTAGRGMQYTDTLHLMPELSVAYQGDRLPIKPRVMLKGFRFWNKQVYNQSKVNQTLTNLLGMNIFSNVRLSFTPRDSTDMCDTLDVRLDATLDKPIDAELDFNITQKSNSQVGPHLGLTFSKRNAFRHGETVSVGLKSSYEWQTELLNTTDDAGLIKEGSRRIDSYEVGLKASISYPWIAFPGLNTKIYRLPTSSSFSVNVDHLRRSAYFRTLTSELEATYAFQTGQKWTHEFTPMSFAYRNVLDLSPEVQELMDKNAYIHASMQEQLIPAMRYTVTYDNTANTRLMRTTHAEFSVMESANMLNGVNALLGFDYTERNKRLLGTPYSQFLKTQIALKNHFRLTKSSEIATRLQVGMLWSYGNSTAAPLSELFYVGGANSVRAFAVRSIGPGSYYDRSGLGSYVYQTGDFRLELNAEYRFPILTDLYGAFFVDAGNVWLMHTDADTFQSGAQLTMRTLLDDLAVGTGLGLRYDLQFLVLRLDCGIGIHAPYDTGKRTYYNIKRFSDGLGIHFAVGYPF